jgi:hypothetical protein
VLFSSWWVRSISSSLFLEQIEFGEWILILNPFLLLSTMIHIRGGKV